MQNLTLKVEGMTCMGCVHSIKRLLSGLNGVEAVDVDLDTGRVRVSFKPGQVQPEAIRQTIEGGGFKVISADAV